jgi:hypothetical protein
MSKSEFDDEFFRLVEEINSSEGVRSRFRNSDQARSRQTNGITG